MDRVSTTKAMGVKTTTTLVHKTRRASTMEAISMEAISMEAIMIEASQWTQATVWCKTGTTSRATTVNSRCNRRLSHIGKRSTSLRRYLSRKTRPKTPQITNRTNRGTSLQWMRSRVKIDSSQGSMRSRHRSSSRSHLRRKVFCHIWRCITWRWLGTAWMRIRRNSRQW